MPSGQTVDEQLTTPQIIRPLSGAPYRCLVTASSGSVGAGFSITYSGYVVSGSFTPPVLKAQPLPTRKGVSQPAS